VTVLPACNGKRHIHFITSFHPQNLNWFPTLSIYPLVSKVTLIVLLFMLKH